MPAPRKITPAGGPINARFALPGSKSYSNRALLCAALSGHPVTLMGLSGGDDTAFMLNILVDLGWRVRRQRVNWSNVDVTPHSHPPGTAGPKHLTAGAGGTTARFALALLTTIVGEHTLDGTARLRQRPMGPLISALRQLGAGIDELGQKGCLPLRVRGGLIKGGKCTVEGSESSQFLSALLMLAPRLEQPVEIMVKGKLASTPYVQATFNVLRAFGVEDGTIRRNGWRKFRVRPSRYDMRVFRVPPDATAASYFWAAAALTRGRCVIDGLQRGESGDAGFVEHLRRMGCRVLEFPDGLGIDASMARKLKAIRADLSDMPDTAQTLAVLCAFANGQSKLTGLSTLRVKETDRIAALANELVKLGAKVRSGLDWIEIEGRQESASAGSKTRPRILIRTYDDHRMAMSFAVAGLALPGIEIENPDCVSKSFPDFWEFFKRLTG